MAAAPRDYIAAIKFFLGILSAKNQGLVHKGKYVSLLYRSTNCENSIKIKQKIEKCKLKFVEFLVLRSTTYFTDSS